MEMLSDMLKANSAIELVQAYHGGLTHTQKEDVISRSHLPLSDGKQEVMLVQLQSGGTGLNLQHFDRIVFSGPWWTSALMEQAVGRAVRIGQKEVVHVYRIQLKEEEAMNIDTYMLQKADTKGGLCKEILSYANTECV
jgi:SNF2 family DNA or RNA helicase